MANPLLGGPAPPAASKFFVLITSPQQYDIRRFPNSAEFVIGAEYYTISIC